MLNKDNVRELAYIVRINDITPIEGYDRVELAHVKGWTIVVGKGEFHPNDLAVYFEIDSQLPEVEPFVNMDFLSKKHYKIKTQKMCKSISQGLLMSAANFGGETYIDGNGIEYFHINGKSYAEGEFLTEALGITYAAADDNARKAPSADKYKRMAQRNGKLFSHQPFRWLMKRTWGKKLLFVFFGRTNDKKNTWPNWVSKTDEERVQNMPWIMNSPDTWVATEKIDGTSTTFTMRRHKSIFGTQYEFIVCSRNVAFDKPDKKCFYETNVYTEMAEKYHVETVLRDILMKNPDLEFVTLQGETYGKGVQNRNYSLEGHDFVGFNLIDSKVGRWGSVEAAAAMTEYAIPWVPILDKEYHLSGTVDELLEFATGKSVIDGLPREGIVFRTLDGKQSFKAVSNEFLLKYHN